MDKYNILIGILLLLIIFDNKMVEGLTLDICDKNDNKFKLLNEKINTLNDGKNIVINNNICDEEMNINKNYSQVDEDDEDDGDDLYKKILFDYIPKILIGILILIFLYFVIDKVFLTRKKVTAMTYEQALDDVKNAKILKSKGIKLK
jgi:hypothetical protein